MASGTDTGLAQERSTSGAVHLILAGLTLAAIGVTVTVGTQSGEAPPRSGGFAANLAAASERSTEAVGASGEPSGTADAPGFHAGSRPEGHAVYLVASEMDASALRRDLQEANAIRLLAGQSPLPYEVVAFQDDSRSFESLYQLDVLNKWNLHDGLPPIVVTDLR